MNEAQRMAEVEKFKNYFSYINRPGADKLLAWLEEAGFFTAPASTKYHGAYAGGLVEHTNHVYRRLVRLADISIHAPARGATSILSKIHPMFLTISHNASSFSSFPFHSFLPHLLNSSTFCALFQVRISRAFSVYYRFAPKKSTPDL